MMSQDYSKNRGTSALSTFQINPFDKPKEPTRVLNAKQDRQHKAALDRFEEIQEAKRLEDDFA